MRKILILFIFSTILSACGTTPFTPSEHPLRAGLIPQFDVAGTVVVSNTQAATGPVFVFAYAGSKLSSDMKAITEAMVQQTTKEVQKNGRQVSEGTPKSIALKVNSLFSNYFAFHWKSKIHFQATLGDGQVLEFSVPHASGDLQQDLNGCIAEGVLILLRDTRVRKYLAS